MRLLVLGGTSSVGRALSAGSWDAVVDVCAHRPGPVRRAPALLAKTAARA